MVSLTSAACASSISLTCPNLMLHVFSEFMHFMRELLGVILYGELPSYMHAFHENMHFLGDARVDCIILHFSTLA